MDITGVSPFSRQLDDFLPAVLRVVLYLWTFLNEPLGSLCSSPAMVVMYANKILLSRPPAAL